MLVGPLKRAQKFWDSSLLCRCAVSSWRFERSSVPRSFHYLTLKLEAQGFSETSATIHQSTRKTSKKTRTFNTVVRTSNLANTQQVPPKRC